MIYTSSYSVVLTNWSFWRNEWYLYHIFKDTNRQQSDRNVLAIIYYFCDNTFLQQSREEAQSESQSVLRCIHSGPKLKPPPNVIKFLRIYVQTLCIRVPAVWRDLLRDFFFARVWIASEAHPISAQGQRESCGEHRGKRGCGYRRTKTDARWSGCEARTQQKGRPI